MCRSVLLKLRSEYAPLLLEQGNLRVTIQGEIIGYQFGEKEVCFRTLDVYTSAMLEATLLPMEDPPQEWRDALTQMSEVSCKAYRGLVFQDEKFIKYFHSSTPVQVGFELTSYRVLSN